MVDPVEIFVQQDLQEVAEGAVPRHVAIIMDGNGRWASRRGLPRTEGHRRGVKTVREIVKRAQEQGVGYLTLFSFSSENWSRPASEVQFLLSLLKRFIRQDLMKLREADVRVRIIGCRHNLPDELLRVLQEAESATEACTGMVLQVAFNYGARAEIVRAVQKLTAEVSAGARSVESIDEEMISQALDTGGMPDPDLIIRTSGEQRLSNFLLWQAAYSEFYFTPLAWPDFDAAAFDDALAAFGARERRFGGLTAKVGP
ncbi:isoprenyl transferase [Polycladidibacter hongkongensis]|uniref:isoprenyl transferase n=1 Tax=Polycladidibacter hongkongensis TaxID=1647556 RepID=UPI000830AD83|nr:isoprenyl transferase [Pseudovibrio hongkongensis]